VKENKSLKEHLGAKKKDKRRVEECRRRQIAIEQIRRNRKQTAITKTYKTSKENMRTYTQQSSKCLKKQLPRKSNNTT